MGEISTNGHVFPTSGAPGKKSKLIYTSRKRLFDLLWFVLAWRFLVVPGISSDVFYRLTIHIHTTYRRRVTLLGSPLQFTTIISVFYPSGMSPMVRGINNPLSEVPAAVFRWPSPPPKIFRLLLTVDPFLYRCYRGIHLWIHYWPWYPFFFRCCIRIHTYLVFCGMYWEISFIVIVKPLGRRRSDMGVVVNLLTINQRLQTTR